MSFASFIGVNRHNQSILLGYALLTSEDIKTYVFVFRTWLVAIGKISPTAIVTDQCESIKAAILEAVRNYKCSKARFLAVIFDSITIAEFEDKCQTFVDEYDVGRRILFQSLYSELSKWVSVFLKHYFGAGIISMQRCESMHAFFDGYISSRSSLKQFVEQYEVALGFKYGKEMESQASKIKQLVRSTTPFDWDMQIYGHYTCAIYDFFRMHVARLPHCEIERHIDFDAVERVEVYNVTNFSIRNDYHGRYPKMMNEYRQYNAMKKWFDRNCDITLDYPVRRKDLKNVLKAHFKAYLDWEDDMAIPNVLNLDSDTDATFVRNLREVRSRGRPQINRNRSLRQNAFREDARRWGSGFYDVYDEG
ncbi:hypothetical protein FXO38_19232 [Capsicum annuum]|nr:hypothetical protein FXO38_19232 [Capsicum annuum]KAF3648967.1 hypothetical protein FXO37_19201 [Capsicum annuum]